MAHVGRFLAICLISAGAAAQVDSDYMYRYTGCYFDGRLGSTDGLCEFLDRALTRADVGLNTNCDAGKLREVYIAHCVADSYDADRACHTLKPEILTFERNRCRLYRDLAALHKEDQVHYCEFFDTHRLINECDAALSEYTTDSERGLLIRHYHPRSQTVTDETGRVIAGPAR